MARGWHTSEQIHGSTRSWATPSGIAQPLGVQVSVAQQGHSQQAAEQPGTSNF